jgi:thioredoxin-related protein
MMTTNEDEDWEFINNYKQIRRKSGINNGKNWFVYIYKPGCPFCQVFNKDGVWEKLKANAELTQRCNLIKIDVTNEKYNINIDELKQGLGFKTVPNFSFFDDEGRFIENYKGARTFGDMSKFIRKYATKRSRKVLEIYNQPKFIFKQPLTKQPQPFTSEITIKNGCKSELPPHYFPCLKIRY